MDLSNISWKTKAKVGLGGFAVIVVLIMWMAIANGWFGRSPSRMLGKNFRQKITIENLASVNDIIGVSYYKELISSGDSVSFGDTIKNITFMGSDGYPYSIEYKDFSPFEGAIRWVPHNEDASILRTRAIARWTGGCVNYKLPEDFMKIIDVNITYDDSGRVKDLVYIATDGNCYSREYREGLMNRMMEGWAEIVPGAKKAAVKPGPRQPA